jgi:hypothetical protein
LYFSPISNTRDVVMSFSTNPNAEGYGATVTLGSQGVQRYTINKLSPLKRYYFKVRGQNGCSVGDWSNILSAKTSGSTLKLGNFYAPR